MPETYNVKFMMIKNFKFNIDILYETIEKILRSILLKVLL